MNNDRIRPLKIGKVVLKNNLIFAPMAGYSDAAYRQICAEAGAGLTVTEMVSAMGLCQGGKATIKLLKTSESEGVKCVQLFGHDPSVFALAAKNPLLSEFDIIDVNMGCPVKKVVRHGEGSALMANPTLAAEIVSAIKNAVDKPVTVKLRLGISTPDLAEELISRVCEAGADAVTVHGRTAKQMYSGESDWDEILRLKKICKTVFIGNGDVRTAERALEVLKNTDGLSIGRGAIGNPFLFAALSHTPFSRTVSQTMIYHLGLLDNYYGNSYACSVFRKFTTHYLTGLNDVKELKLAIYKCKKVSDIVALIEENSRKIDGNK